MEASPRTQRGTPYRRTFLDFIAAWLCLGIPYLYANRHTYRFDEEGGLMRSAGPMLVVGATVCIVACFSGFFLIFYRTNLISQKGRDHPGGVVDVHRVARPGSSIEDGRLHRNYRSVRQPRSVRDSRFQEQHRSPAVGGARR